MDALWQEIQTEVTQAGSVSFARLMELALYSEHGYYTERVRIGKAGGDFYTASQSELFALTLARCIEHQRAQWGNPPTLQILEVGGGQGELAEGIGRALNKTGIPGQVLYRIREASPYLRQVQRDRLRSNALGVGEETRKRVDVVDKDVVRMGAVTFSWGPAEKTIPTIIIANEVLDALAVERIRRTDKGWQQLYAQWAPAEGHETPILNWVWKDAKENVASLAEAYVNCPVGHEAEISEGYAELMTSVLEGYTAPMLALWFDYGISREEWETGIRPEGTLRAYRQHQLVDVLDNFTNADITADTNWTQAEAMANGVGLSTELVSQGKFLMDNGIIDLAVERQQASSDILAGSRWVAQFKQLALPGGMGDRFSVLVCKTR